MSPLRTKILKNIAWLFSGQMIGRLIRTLLLIYAARVLGTAGFGAFSYALSIAAFLSIFADLGITSYTTRELSKSNDLKSKTKTLNPDNSPNNSKSILGSALTLKLIITSILGIIVFFIGPLLSNIPEAQILIPIAVLVFICDSLRDFGAAISRAAEKMHLEANLNILTNIFITIAGLTLLFFYANAIALMWGYALGASLGLIATTITFRRELSGIFKYADPRQFLPLLKIALPMSAIGLMGAIMVNTDIIMIGWLLSASDTGLYAAAQKPIQVFYLLPAVAAISIFPFFSRRHQDQAIMSTALSKSLTGILLIALPLALGGAILASPLINLLYGNEYLASSASFSVLALSLIIVFPSMILGNAIFAMNEQKKLIAYSLFGISGNIILNLTLIPILGILGSAVATLINQTLINLYLFHKVNTLRPFSLIPNLKKIILATAFMAFVVYILHTSGLNIILTIPLGALIYTLTLFFLREPLLKELTNLKPQNSQN